MLNKLSTLPRAYVRALLFVASWIMIAVPVWLICRPSYWAASASCVIVTLVLAVVPTDDDKIHMLAALFAIAAAVFALCAVA